MGEKVSKRVININKKSNIKCQNRKYWGEYTKCKCEKSSNYLKLKDYYCKCEHFEWDEPIAQYYKENYEKTVDYNKVVNTNLRLLLCKMLKEYIGYDDYVYPMADKYSELITILLQTHCDKTYTISDFIIELDKNASELRGKGLYYSTKTGLSDRKVILDIKDVIKQSTYYDYICWYDN